MVAAAGHMHRGKMHKMLKRYNMCLKPLKRTLARPSTLYLYWYVWWVYLPTSRDASTTLSGPRRLDLWAALYMSRSSGHLNQSTEGKLANQYKTFTFTGMARLKWRGTRSYISDNELSRNNQQGQGNITRIYVLLLQYVLAIDKVQEIACSAMRRERAACFTWHPNSHKERSFLHHI